MNNYILTIITINLNNSTGLLKTIESILNQTFKAFEYILIDGGSLDGSVDIIKSYENRIDYWISEKDSGIYNAMNKGIKRAKGEYCLFLNSGDIFVTDTIIGEVIPQLVDSSIIYGDGLVEKKDKTFENFNTPEKLSIDFFYSSSLCHASTFIAKQLFDTFGLYNEQNKIVSDWEFFIKTIVLNNVSAKKIPLTISIIKDGGISRDPTNINLLREEIDRVRDQHFPIDVQALIQSHKKLQPEQKKFEIDNKSQKHELRFYKKNYIIKSLSKLKRFKSFLFLRFSKPSKKNQIKNKFTHIFNKNSFNGTISVSGPGSDLLQTRVIRNEIPKLFEKYKIKSFIDAPCGDFYWMQHVKLAGTKYIGIDIVREIIKINRKKYKNQQRKFICKNIITDNLPPADLILTRDCWVHLTNNDIILCIRNLKRSRIKYLLTTSFTEMVSNNDLDGIWRPINLELPPFNFPKPIAIINENCTENGGIYSDKSLSMWEISKLSNH